MTPLLLSTLTPELRHVAALARAARALGWASGPRLFEEHLHGLRAAGLACRCGDYWRLSPRALALNGRAA